MRESAKVAIPDLIPLLKDSDRGVRRSTVSILGFIGESAKVAIPDLIPLLKDSDSEVRRSTVSILGSMGESAKVAIPDIVPLLKDPDQAVQSAARDSLRKIEEPEKRRAEHYMLLLLISFLILFNKWTRSAAAEALKKLGYKP